MRVPVFRRIVGASHVRSRSRQLAQGVLPPRCDADAPAQAAEARRGARGRDVHDGARRVRRHPGPERLGQVNAGPAAVDAAAARRRQRDDLRPRRRQGVARRAAARQPCVGRGLVLQEDVVGGEPLVRGAVLRHGPARDATRRSPRSSSRVGFPIGPQARGHGAPVPRHAAEGRACARAADVTRPAAARRADDRARSAVQARGAGLHPRRADDARRDDPALHARPAARRRCWRTGSASSTAAS